MNNETVKEPTIIWKRYQDGLRYMERLGLLAEWEECENFFEGNHWPAPTPKTKNLPRPVVNVTAMIADNKKSRILSGNPKMMFRATERFGEYAELAEEGADIFTKFSESLSKELDQGELDDQAQDYATQLGTYIYHYYWDTQIYGGLETPYIGGLRGEVLHPKNVVVSNPFEKNEQKQKYIIISSTETVESIRELAKKNGIQNLELIKADNENDDTAFVDKKVCTVLTQYSRQNGKVVWEKATKDVYIQKPTLWQPEKEKVTLEDFEETTEPDMVSTNNDTFRNQLYPLIISSHKSRKNCIYGIGEVKPAIPNNKAINFNLGMMLLSVQQTAWPKLLQKMNALANQQITNAPGEVITDTSKGQGWGIKYMETPSFNPQAMQLTNTILDLTRTTTGSSEVTTGEAIGANMAASAIIALQTEAKKPIEILQKKFYRTYSKIGQVWQQFFKYYYNDNRMFGYDEDGQNFVGVMNGQKYQDIDYTSTVDVGSSGIYSEALTIQLLDNMKASQDIDTDEYIELYPDSIMTFKPKLKQLRQKKIEAQLQNINQNPLINGMPGGEIPNQNIPPINNEIIA